MKFSIRDLFLVTMIVALTVGWCVDHRASRARERELRHDAELLATEYSGKETDEIRAVLEKYGWEY
jgi:hypothetical protein